MKPDKLKDILLEKTDLLAELFAGINVHFEEELVHQFRVAFKDLRAIVRFYNICEGSPDLKVLGGIKEMYHVLGLVREAQNERKSLVEYSLRVPSYYELLNQAIMSVAAKWLTAYSEREFETLLTYVKDHDFRALHLSDLARFEQVKIRKLREILSQGEITDEKLHEVRKQMKDIHYVARFVTSNWKNGSQYIEKWPGSAISKLTEDLGNYNDLRLLREHLIDFVLNGGIGNEEHKVIDQFISNTTQHSVRSKVQVTTAARDLLLNW